jgi:hypothetical protein
MARFRADQKNVTGFPRWMIESDLRYRMARFYQFDNELPGSDLGEVGLFSGVLDLIGAPNNRRLGRPFYSPRPS